MAGSRQSLDGRTPHKMGRPGRRKDLEFVEGVVSLHNIDSGVG